MGRKTTKPIKKSGNSRFGYSPSPEAHRPPAVFTYQIGQRERQERLEAIKLDRLQREWRQDRFDKGREAWCNFGNKDLPIYKDKSEVMKMVAMNRISLLAGETGSGKSTQLAQYALEMGYDHIVYLQPRRVTVDGISDRIDEELTEQFATRGIDKPESLVGMAHSGRSTMQDDSMIQVMTSAVFTRRAEQLQEEWADKKVLIVADEVHEGNIETEFAIATAAECMTEQDSWNMVLMSATLNTEEIQDAYTVINGQPIPQVTVEGRPYDIEQLEEPELDVAGAFEKHCLDGHKTLIFTDGKRSMSAIADELYIRHGAKQPQLNILFLHSKITEHERNQIFSTAADPDVHTVIISTSAGQSGITIPGVDRVISDGWTKSPELDNENAAGLPRRLCSRAELTQQMGRGGRDIDGAKFILTNPLEGYEKSVRLELSDFSSFASEERLDHTPADIYHTIITQNVLLASAMRKDFYTLNEFLIHKVTHDTINEAYAVLGLMDAVDDNNEVTSIGREMAKYPLRPELSRSIAEVAKGGSVAQKSQLAAMVASIEAGGLGSRVGEKDDRLETLRSPATKDDFFAELDYFISVSPHARIAEADEEVAADLSCADGATSGKVFIEQGPRLYVDYAALPALLDRQNVKRAYKQYTKICRAMGVDLEDAYGALSVPSSDEDRSAVHDMLLTGMSHLLYEEVARKKWRGRKKTGKSGEKITPNPVVTYRNLLGPEPDRDYEYDRTVSSRSLLTKRKLAKPSIIAGYPRWFIDDKGSTINIIDKGFETSESAIRRVLGRTARQMREETVIGPDGRLRLVSSNSIGRMSLSRTVEKDSATTISKADLLAQKALQVPGPAQRELRLLKKRLEDLASRIPQSHLSHYISKEIITDEALREIVYRAADGSHSTGQLDANIRNIMYTEDLDLNSFFSPEIVATIEANMPRQMMIGGDYYDLRYDGPDAEVVISQFPHLAVDSLPMGKLTIGDGREVSFRYRTADGREYVLSSGELRQLYAQEGRK